jgi:nucleoside 2-deoxyribosyltransferase
MIKVYLACAYSHPDPAIREQRVLQADQCAAWLLEQGYNVFSPLSHSHRIAHHMNNHNNSEYWVNLDLDFIDWCDVVAVMKIDGWKESKGIRKELEFAALHGKPVMEIERGAYGWHILS